MNTDSFMMHVVLTVHGEIMQIYAPTIAASSALIVSSYSKLYEIRIHITSRSDAA